MIPFIDAHLHPESRPQEDFERLREAGCLGIAALAGGVGVYSEAVCLRDSFRRLAEFDSERARRAGLKVFLGLGIHPARIPDRGLEELLADLPALLKNAGAAAVGEIGLERGDEIERRTLRCQLDIAADAGLPAVIHTPREEKRQRLEAVIEILRLSRLPPERALLDHLDEETIDIAAGAGCALGLSVHPAKLTPTRAAALAGSRPGARCLLSSDMGARPSWLFAVPAAIVAMQDAGIPDAVVRDCAAGRAAAFFLRAS
jgi:predicted metal-dependent TIM-barrel fold hydrolase